jgi:DNA-binding MarR family transcriptional regulator
LAWVRAFLRRVRELEGDMSLQRLQVLLEVAAVNDEIGLQELISRLDISPSHLTKMVQSWSHRTASKQPGPGYCDVQPDPMNLKTKLASITKRGEKRVAEMMVFKGE